MKKLFVPIVSVLILSGLCSCSSKNETTKMNSTSTVLMVEPVNFKFNTQTAETNAFMRQEADSLTQTNALEQFNNYVDLLRKHGIDVVVVKDTEDPVTPDSIFPNNWFSTHPDGKVVLYPMCAPNRRAERKQAALDSINALCDGYETVDLTGWEENGEFLEGTGSMVLDRINRIAYACLSPRTSEKVLNVFCEKMGYTPVIFEAADAAGTPIYHTNVMMAIGTSIAILCEDSIVSPEDLAKVKESLTRSGRKIISISLKQMTDFAGNMLEVNDGKGKVFFVMSATALASLDQSQIDAISEYATIIAPDIHTIEINGGGSARCMLAEIF